ncbi:uncharacterized protein LOC118438528 [Folsomia candida]|uniref:uncharacterized protein LOC118438528 n=1 Tax=Folsomia candida TaxID=158441 RepID=UPI001604CF07|nr:uncharacterized protein LOC118438528 [Folsomia candida]
MHLWGGGGNKKQDKRQRQQSNSPEEQGSKKRTNLEDDFIMDVNKIMEKMDAQHKEVLTKHTEVFDRLNKIEGKCDINSQKAFAAIEELKREKSIVFYGFPETGTETLETQIAEVEKLLQKMGLNNPIIDDIFRMGKKTPTEIHLAKWEEEAWQRGPDSGKRQNTSGESGREKIHGKIQGIKGSGQGHTDGYLQRKDDDKEEQNNHQNLHLRFYDGYNSTTVTWTAHGTYNSYRIMKKEEVPLEWTESVTCMIFKEGDESNPANYRPISLLNTMLKLFTQVLYGRLVIWAEKNKLIPECQGGFRSGRSCEDQILCLQTAIHAKLKQEKGNALFVDFERCFNTLPHNKMWNKLFSLGMSGKIIRILKSLYENASTRVRMEHGLTQPIDITEGVMQGEIVSPFLYSLYVSEMEKLLINSNIPGVKIERDFFLHLLCYADDTVVLASTPINLQHKINILKEYFEELGLKVNLSKTKIMVLGKVRYKVRYYK